MLFGCSKCCGCGEPCSRCNQSCLSLTIEGFAGPTGQQCSECDGVNGTYTLSRGTGAPPSIRASIQDTTGTGAVIAATLGYQPSDGSYTITKASINKKGTCYTKNAAFAYTLDGASVACDDEPVVTVEVERTEPLLNFGAIDDRFAPLGTGASLQPSFTPVATTPGAQTWGISSVSVAAGGTNYDDYSPISIKTKGCTVTIRPAVASIRTPRDQPIETAVFVDSKTGSGAVLDLQWEEVSLPANQWHPAGAVAWRATGATILSGGSGYTADDVVKYTLDSSHRYASGSPDPIILAQGSLTIPLYGLAFSNIGPGGSLVGVIGTDWPFDLTNDSLFWYRGGNGSIQSVTVTDGGEYYTPGGVASLTIQDGGTFWPDEPCNYGYCGPSACKVNGETQCRQLSVNIGNNDRKLTISSDSGVLIQATVPADGYPCDGITFASKEITSSCATVGTITLAGATCSGPSQDSCCRECSRCIRTVTAYHPYLPPVTLNQWDCQYTTQESCEDCTRTYTCIEMLQSECDGTCFDTGEPSEPRVMSFHPDWPTWWCLDYDPNRFGYYNDARALATIGCGKIISVVLDPSSHTGYPPFGFAKRGRVAPTITATAAQEGASGAVLSVSLSQTTDQCGFDIWELAAINVVSPGTGYTVGQEWDGVVQITESPGDDVCWGCGGGFAQAWIDAVDEDGGILSVSFYGGKYFRESTTAPPYIAPVSIGYPSGGTGAVVTPTIDTNTSSPTFGHVTGFTVEDGGSGYVSLCSRERSVESCDECPPRQQPEFAGCSVNVANDGKPCGTWTPGFPCVDPPCCDSCLPECSVNINVVESTADYLKQSYGQDPENDMFIETIPWVDAFLESIAGFNCTLIWVYDAVAQTNATGEPCGSLNGVTQKAIRSWYRYRLFLVDCRTRSIREVTDEALSEELSYTICNYPGFPAPLCGPPFCNDNANPGFLDAAPTLVCP